MWATKKKENLLQKLLAIWIMIKLYFFHNGISKEIRDKKISLLLSKLIEPYRFDWEDLNISKSSCAVNEAINFLKSVYWAMINEIESLND